MSVLLYFAYGSNLLPRRLQARVPSARPRRTVQISGWSLRFHKRGQDGSAKCNLLRTGVSADIAHGAVYEIAADERAHLDRAEGLGHGYELAWLELEELGRVFLYCAAETHIDERLRPFTWYKDYVTAGARHHGFPAGYIASIRSIGAVHDPDPERHRQNLALLTAGHFE